MNEAQRQLAEQSARNLAAEAAAVDAATADAWEAYAAYAEATGGKTWDGRDMPTWDQLGERIQGAWRAAATAVAARHEVAGVRRVRVHVTEVHQVEGIGPWAKVEPLDGEPFTGDAPLVAVADAAFLAVTFPDPRRPGVLRFDQPLTPEVGATADALLIAGR